MEVTIEGTKYPIKMNMLAIREYKRLTGKNIIGQKALEDIFGSIAGGVVGDFDAGLFVTFLYVLLVNGSYPDPPKYSIDELANIISFSDGLLGKAMTACWLMGQTGQSQDQVEKQMEEAAKNRLSPLDGEKILSGTKSSDSPMENSDSGPGN
jgi:hypothetical protein